MKLSSYIELKLLSLKSKKIFCFLIIPVLLLIFVSLIKVKTYTSGYVVKYDNTHYISCEEKCDISNRYFRYKGKDYHFDVLNKNDEIMQIKIKNKINIVSSEKISIPHKNERLIIYLYKIFKRSFK